MASDSTSYFAAAPTEEIGARIYGKVESAQANLLTPAITKRLQRAYQYAYGLDEAGTHAASQVIRGGEVGELTLVKLNHARALVNTLSNLVSAPKVVWAPKAVNLDYDSLRETDLARAVLEFYWSGRQVSRHAVTALDQSLFFGEGFVLLDWNESGGEDFAAMPEDAPLDPLADPNAPPPEPVTTMQKAGDVTFRNIPPWDIIRDPTKTSWEANDWIIVTYPANKWDLAAQYPDMAEEILKCAPGERLGVPVSSNNTPADTDDVMLCRFYHKKTPAVPLGREVILLSSKAVLDDRDLRWDELPLVRMSAGEQAGTSYGYSAYFDTLGVQELMDSLHSVAASNQSTFGGQVIAAEEGSEVQPEDVGGGIRMIYVPPGSKDPKALELCKTPAELFSYLGTLRKEQELVIGLNGIVRGEAPPGGLSGSALALLQSQALQQSSAVQANYLRMIESLGTLLVQTIQRFATRPQKVALVGVSNSSLVQEREYTGADIKRICRVQVEIGNPLAQTAAGRVDIAKELIGMKLIQTVEQYEQVLSTGRLEPLTQSLHHEMLLIRSEGEQMARGELPVVCVLDNHMLHVREHKVLVSSPEIRKNPAILQVVLQHIQEHQDSYYAAPPETLLMMGQPLPPMPMMPPGASPGAPNMPSGALGSKDTGGPGPDGNAPPPKPSQAANGSAAKPANLPSQPKNPATGQKFAPPVDPKVP